MSLRFWPREIKLRAEQTQLNRGKPLFIACKNRSKANTTLPCCKKPFCAERIQLGFTVRDSKAVAQQIPYRGWKPCTLPQPFLSFAGSISWLHAVLAQYSLQLPSVGIPCWVGPGCGVGTEQPCATACRVGLWAAASILFIRAAVNCKVRVTWRGQGEEKHW